MSVLHRFRRPRVPTVLDHPGSVEPAGAAAGDLAESAPEPDRSARDLLVAVGRVLRTGGSTATTEGTVLMCDLGLLPIAVAVAAADTDDAHRRVRANPRDPAAVAAYHAAHRRLCYLTADPAQPV